MRLACEPVAARGLETAAAAAAIKEAEAIELLSIGFETVAALARSHSRSRASCCACCAETPEEAEFRPALGVREYVERPFRAALERLSEALGTCRYGDACD